MRSATLRISDASGAIDDVHLSALAYGGSTRVVLTSDAGTSSARARSTASPPSNAVILAGGTRRRVSFDVAGVDGSWWKADFEPDGSLRTFGATFVQHCEGGAPALRGTFEFRAGSPAPPPPSPPPAPPPPPPPPAPPPPPPAPPPPPPPPAALPPAPGKAPKITAPVGGSITTIPAGACRQIRFEEAKLLLGTGRADRIDGRSRAEVFVARADRVRNCERVVRS